jgi:hypothetical protein
MQARAHVFAQKRHVFRAGRASVEARPLRFAAAHFVSRSGAEEPPSRADSPAAVRAAQIN